MLAQKKAQKYSFLLIDFFFFYINEFSLYLRLTNQILTSCLPTF